MTTHKQDLSKLSINQISQISGMAYNTIKRRLAGLDPIGKDGRTLMFLTTAALPKIYGAKAESEKDRLDRLRGDKVDFELSIGKGEHMPIDDVEQIMAETASMLVGGLTSFGPRLAGQLANTTDPMEILKLLNAEIRSVRQTITDTLEDAKRQLPPLE